MDYGLCLIDLLTNDLLTTMTTFRYSLDATSKKNNCPQCGNKTLVRYKDNKTGEYLPQDAGRCDRENNCGYHKTPKMIADLGISGFGDYKPTYLHPKIPKSQNPEMLYLSLSYIERCENSFTQTHFMQWLIGTFGNNKAIRAAKEYLIGRSKQKDGRGCIFWQIDIDCNVRTGKIMHYNPTTGKRIKGDGSISFVHAYIQGFTKHPNQLCFFGEHLLAMHPSRPVAVVESEKTAIVCFILMPHIVWLATGGLNGCGLQNYAVYKALAGRHVTFYPDYGFANKKTGKTCYQHWLETVNTISEKLHGSFYVSDVLEKLLYDKPRNDEDIADVVMGLA